MRFIIIIIKFSFVYIAVFLVLIEFIVQNIHCSSISSTIGLNISESTISLSGAGSNKNVNISSNNNNNNFIKKNNNNNKIVKVEFVAYNKNNNNSIIQEIKLKLHDDATYSNLLDPSPNPMIIFTHGLLEDVSSTGSSWNFMKNAYLKSGFANLIIFVKWELIHYHQNSTRRIILQNTGFLNSKNPTSIVNEISNQIATFIINIKKQALVYSNATAKVHLIGQSIGAHIMGQVGRQLNQNHDSQMLIDRITGLDPLSLSLINIPKNSSTNTNNIGFGLDKTCALFVDVIHTDTNGFGSIRSFGHVDWFSNGGLNYAQNACYFKELPMLISEIITIGCAHARATQLWTFSLLNEEPGGGGRGLLYGCPCQKVIGQPLRQNHCQIKNSNTSSCTNNVTKLQFGQNTPTTGRGNYYLPIPDSLIQQLSIKYNFTNYKD